MVTKITQGKNLVFVFVCVVLLGLSSCKTTRKVTTSVAKPISTNKLIRNIENNAFDYRHLAIKRITCQFDNGKTKTSFKASIWADKDKSITVMLSKLNIPVGRLWLTPDSVKFINYFEKNYFLDDYSYLSSVLDMDLDFRTIHAIISNNVFALGEEKSEKEIRDYESRIDSGMYVLESVKKLNSRKDNQKINVRKQARKAQKIITNGIVHQTIYIDPETYKRRKIKIEDAENSRKLNIDFSDFVAVEKQLYPGEIFIHFASPDSFMQLKIKLNGFSMEKEKDVRFRVPDKYTRINR